MLFINVCIYKNTLTCFRQSNLVECRLHDVIYTTKYLNIMPHFQSIFLIHGQVPETINWTMIRYNEGSNLSIQLNKPSGQCLQFWTTEYRWIVLWTTEPQEPPDISIQIITFKVDKQTLLSSWQILKSAVYSTARIKTPY